MKKLRYDRLSNIAYILKNIWHWDKTVLLFVTLQAAAGVLLAAMGVYLPKLVIDEVTHFKTNFSLVMVIGAFTLVMAIMSFIERYSTANVNSSAMANRIRYFFMRNLKAMDCDYSNIESAEGQTMYQKLNGAILNDSGGPQGLVRTLPLLLSGAAGFLLFGGVISMLNPLVVALLLLTSAINWFVLRHTSKYIELFRTQGSVIDKRIAYLMNKVADFHAAKDIRLYCISGWFMKVYEDLVGQDKAKNIKLAKKEYLSNVTAVITLIFRDSAAYAVLIWYISKGYIGASDFVLYFGAISGFSSFVNSIIDNLYSIDRASLDITAIREYLDMPDASNRYIGVPLPTKESQPLSIEFRNVWFRYSENGDYILKDFNLDICPGEKLALVGANGAGKTTIVKILCGFYRPERGEILIGGIPLDSFNRDQAYTLFSVVFQDIFIVPFSVAKNVALCYDEQIDRERVTRCIAMAGLSKRLEDIDAVLLKVMRPDGIELSGGEAQKLILARALYKDTPILLLDEPTASLDPIAESEMYRHYNNFSGGKTSIYISHRLASTSFCDRVAFIEDGRVAQLGTHIDLMAHGGGYKKMFDIQSCYYKEHIEEVAADA